MGHSIQILDIILLAMIAGFIALRLRSVLGRRTGEEDEPAELKKKREQAHKNHLRLVENDNTPPEDTPFVPGPDPVDLTHLSKPARNNLDNILSLEPDFSIEQFMEGARKAYPMILEAFWLGQMEDVKDFLSDNVFTMFSGAITAREKEGLTLENNLIETRENNLVDIEIVDRVMNITVRFISDIVSITRDENNEVVDGDLSDTVEVVDIWTFSREIGSRDPNWLLFATRAG